MADKRITGLTTTTSLSSGDYVVVDSSASGTRKYDLKSLKDAIPTTVTDLSDEANYLLEANVTVLTAAQVAALF